MEQYELVGPDLHYSSVDLSLALATMSDATKCVLVAFGCCSVQAHRVGVTGLTHRCFYCRGLLHGAINPLCGATQVPGEEEGRCCCPFSNPDADAACRRINQQRIRNGEIGQEETDRMRPEHASASASGVSASVPSTPQRQVPPSPSRFLPPTPGNEHTAVPEADDGGLEGLLSPHPRRMLGTDPFDGESDADVDDEVEMVTQLADNNEEEAELGVFELAENEDEPCPPLAQAQLHDEDDDERPLLRQRLDGAGLNEPAEHRMLQAKIQPGHRGNMSRPKAYAEGLISDFTARVCRRNDATPLPHPSDPPFKWEPNADKDGFTLVGRDGTCTAENSAKAIFGNDCVVSCECAFHASPSWWGKTKHDLWTDPRADAVKTAKSLLSKDFALYCATPYLHIVPVVREYMLDCWKHPKGRNQPAIAAAWESFYGSARLTKIEANSGCGGLRGGISNTSVIIERGNRSDKEMKAYKKNAPVDFIIRTAALLHGQSITDLDWFGRMKIAVHSRKFFTNCFRTMHSYNLQKPCLLNLQYSFTNRDETLDLPSGSFIVPSYRTLKELRMAHGRDSWTIADAKRLLRPLVDTYKRVVKRPEQALSAVEEEGRFEEITYWLQSFRCLRPLVASEFPEATRSLYVMLETHGYTLVSWDDLLELGKKGFVLCDCRKHLHYSWCYHCCSVATQRGIILGWPPSLDETRQWESRIGRLAAAHPGQALNRDD